ncbi:MAG: hypothetical protein ACREX9_10020 [Gammaproteobacteria bacterium]
MGSTLLLYKQVLGRELEWLDNVRTPGTGAGGLDRGRGTALLRQLEGRH